MRLLITGASGFIGKNLLLKLLKCRNDTEIIATYNRSEDFCTFLQKNDLDNVNAIKVDITDLCAVKEAFRKTGNEFDITVHLVASPAEIRLSAKEPQEDLRIATYSLLNIMTSTKTRDLIFMSSGAVYDGHKGPVSPTTPTDPSFPYAISKLTCEHYVKYAEKYGLIDNYVILRFFGCYGPYESPRKIYTALVKNFYLEGKNEFTIIGDGNNLIDAMYVDDAMEGLAAVMRSSIRNVVIDFARGTPITINELVTKVGEILGKEKITLQHTARPVEYISFYSTSKQMEKLFGFKPSTPLKTGIWKLARFLEMKEKSLSTAVH